jgi:hypothetical protein
VEAWKSVSPVNEPNVWRHSKVSMSHSCEANERRESMSLVTSWPGGMYLDGVVKGTCDEPSIVKLHTIDGACVPVRAILV